ncbi:MAG: serine hydrolase [Protaetiibacter sp.]
MVDAPELTGRRARVQQARAPRHRSELPEPGFGGAFRALGELAYGGAQVSASVIDLDSDARLLSIDDRIVLPTASVGKILLLIEVSARLSEQAAPALELLDKTAKDAVGDSGLWRHLQARSLPLADVATLVAATSDNLATNVLLREVGLEAVRARTEELGLLRTALLDLVRDTRGPDDAPQLSVGSTAELAWLFAALARGKIVDPLTSSRVLGWLSLNTDLSLVASAFGVDPLSHRGVDHGLQLVNKTGTDTGVRSEAGVLRGPRRGVSYAVSVQFSDRSIASRLRVLDALRTVGFDLLDYVH